MFHPTRTVSVLALLLAAPVFALAQDVKASSDARLANALLAGPQFVVTNATVLDWPASEGGEFAVLRKGSNGFYCLPDLPITEGDDPMCVDQVWLDFLKAFVSGKKPTATTIGFGYMIHGGATGSAIDPMATKAAPDNDWGFDGPHLMLVVPDLKSVAGLPTKRSDGPYVMWANTPYAHVMVPISDHSKHGMK